MCGRLPDSRPKLELPASFLTVNWKDLLATDELKTEGEPTKPYVLYRVGANDEIIERIAEGDSVEDLFKVHRRRLNSKYVVYHRGKKNSYRAGSFKH
jgi:hypothetical protein